jgi:predicted GTPase
VVLAVNKWDAVDAYQRELLQRSIETRLGILKFASIHHISAIKRRGFGTRSEIHHSGARFGESQDVHTSFDPFVDGGRAV